MRAFLKLILLTLGTLAILMGQSFALNRALSPEESAAIQKISAHHSAIEYMAGRFIQTNSTGERIEGIFYLHRPNKIRFKYAPPSYEEVISTGRGFYVIDRKERTSFAYPQNRVPLRQFLTDKIDLFAANIQDVTMTDEMIAIQISDETPAGPVGVTMFFNLKTSEVQQWKLIEPNGNEVSFSIYDITTDIKIPKAYFYLPDFEN